MNLDLSNAFTDILLAVLAITFFLLLKGEIIVSQRYWKYAFLFLGLSALISSVAHAQPWYHGKIIHVAGWIVNAVSVYCMERASLYELLNVRLIKYLAWFIAVQFFMFVIAAMLVQDFKVVEVNAGIGLFGVLLPIYTTRYIEYREKGTLFILLGILSLIVPALLFNHGESQGKVFDHSDMSHICLLITVTLLFIGVKRYVTQEK